MREPVDLLGHPLPGEGFQHLDNTGMQPLPPLQEEAAVGHLVGEGVLEDVLALRKEARFVEKLRSL